jgi:hypothetical protein
MEAVVERENMVKALRQVERTRVCGCGWISITNLGSVFASTGRASKKSCGG